MFLATLYTHLANFHKPFICLLQDKGYEVHAAASNSEGRREEIEKLGAICHEIPFSRVPLSFQNKKAAVVLQQILASNRYDLVHVHTPVAGFIGRYLAGAAGQKVIYTAHGFHFYQGAPLINRLVYYPTERIAARWTDALIVMNEEDYQAGRNLGFVPGETLFFVHGVGVDLNSFSSQRMFSGLRNDLHISKEHVVIACVAEFTPRKNHRFLLDAWSILAGRRKDIDLVLVGEGMLRGSLERYVRGKNIPGVHFLRFRRDIPEILQESDIVTLVSKHEGLPKCLMEAMASGRPVAASDVRGSRDLVEDGKTGYLVSLESVDGLVRALESLVNDKGLRQSMGQEALSRIQNYSVEKVLKEMGKIYDRFLR